MIVYGYHVLQYYPNVHDWLVQMMVYDYQMLQYCLTAHDWLVQMMVLITICYNIT